MHVLTITTKFTFGDKVRFDSTNGKGIGKVFAITVNLDKSTEYLIEVDMGQYSDLIADIVDADIVEKLESGETASTNPIAVASKYTFGDVVRFDSVNGKGTGTVAAIMVDWDKRISYVVDLQPGIMEDEVLEKVADGELGNS